MNIILVCPRDHHINDVDQNYQLVSIDHLHQTVKTYLYQVSQQRMLFIPYLSDHHAILGSVTVSYTLYVLIHTLVTTQ